MGFHLLLRSIESMRDISTLRDFIINQQLTYKGYDAWVERTVVQLAREEKQAALAFSEGVLVGDIIFQPHHTIPLFGEVKNLRLHPRMRGKKVGACLLRNVECLLHEQGYAGVVGDAPASRPALASFLVSQGYTPLPPLALYDTNAPEVPFVKVFGSDPDQHFFHQAYQGILASAW